jgi:hypothetical protein
VWPEPGEARQLFAPRLGWAARPQSPARGPCSLPEFCPPAGNLEGKLTAFLDWVQSATGCSAVFVADSDGITLAERTSEPVLPAIAAALSNSLKMVRALSETVHPESISLLLSSDSLLTVLDLSTSWGRFLIGIVLRPPAELLLTAPQQVLARILDSDFLS